MTTVEKKSLKVGKYVDTHHVDTMVRNYKQERWIYNTERIGKEDSLSAWYSVEELEEFIQTIKEHGADGIKFYFAAYPAEFPEKPEFASRQTIVMVATKSKDAGDGATSNKDIYVGTNNGTNILAYNYSSICPPFCGGNTASDFSGIGLAVIDRGEKGTIVI